jgi:hypothetical protein
MNLVLLLPLKPGATGRARDLLKHGPPFDPAEAGLERHQVFLAEDEAIFVFEADAGDAVERLAADESIWQAAAGWGDLVAGPPRLADQAYAWSRPHPPEDTSFASTPGQGDSEGGDVYTPEQSGGPDV